MIYHICWNESRNGHVRILETTIIEILVKYRRLSSTIIGLVLSLLVSFFMPFVSYLDPTKG